MTLCGGGCGCFQGDFEAELFKLGDETVGSPLGAALRGKRVGDTVSYDAPGGTFEYRVVSFEPHTPS